MSEAPRGDLSVAIQMVFCQCGHIMLSMTGDYLCANHLCPYWQMKVRIECAAKEVP